MVLLLLLLLFLDPLLRAPQPVVHPFFFQAEDGIRDVAVTGVQTCALPIYTRMAISLRLATNSLRMGAGVGSSGMVDGLSVMIQQSAQVARPRREFTVVSILDRKSVV